MNILPFRTPLPPEIAEARELLSGLLDLDLAQGSLHALREAAGHLDNATVGAWQPSTPAYVEDPQVAVTRVHAVLVDVLQRPAAHLDRYRLGLALREIALALALLDRPRGGSA